MKIEKGVTQRSQVLEVVISLSDILASRSIPEGPGIVQSVGFLIGLH